ncbi:MAG: XRE family transcriptional regulator [Gammaproteobacteria bacterium]|nr:XRE family transcriptional regulator [Gammaproteobacteria bacterium]
MISSIFITYQELMAHITKTAQAKRLSLDWSQQTLSERSGVSFGVIKKFERTGKISLESLSKIAVVLGSVEDFMGLFKLTSMEEIKSLDELLEQKKRKRGRK